MFIKALRVLKITGKVLDFSAKIRIKYTYHQARNSTIFFFGYVDFERQMQQCFSKSESYENNSQDEKPYFR